MHGSRLRRFFVAIAGRLTTVALVGCGSSSNQGVSSGTDGGAVSPGGCQPPNLDGSVFGSTGTATLTGAGTLPDGIPDGLELELLVKDDRFSVGVLPDDLLAANDRICGKSFHYTVKKIAAGTHMLTFEVFDTSSNSSMPSFEGTAPGNFTITDGQTLTLDTTFQLSGM